MAKMLGQFAQAFVDTTTMRGFGKFARTPHTSMKLLWFVYIVSMISLLACSSYLLIAEYLSFHTTMQMSEVIHDITDLPAITVCSQSPIGRKAIRLWRNATLLSPSDLSLRIRRAMLQAYRQREFGVATDLFYADRLSTYVQNIPLKYLKTVGLQSDELLLFCVMQHSKNNNPSVSHDEVCRMRVHWIRHPVYANCYEINIHKEDSPQVSSVSLVLRSGHLPAKMNTPLDSHVHDVFTQSQGFRVTLHEPETYPEIDAKGVSVGLGKLTEIKYQVLSNRHLNLGVEGRVCMSNAESKRQQLQDFDRRFDYTYSACISEALGEIILRECKCVSAFHLIDKFPNSTHPFCHYFSPDGLSDFKRRLQCVRNIEIPAEVHRIRATTCSSRCEYKEYPMQVSSTHWLPTSWQLEFAMIIAKAWDTLAAAQNSPANSSSVREAERDALEFMNSNNLSHAHSSWKFDLKQMSLVTVSRLSYNSIHHVETQQITSFALLSRIGGMGSLTIGCTLAFVFEVLEMLFLYVSRIREAERVRRRRKGSAEGNSAAQGDQNCENLSLKEDERQQ